MTRPFMLAQRSIFSSAAGVVSLTLCRFSLSCPVASVSGGEG
eukprot:CAMPEP_0182594238 /NCGR_PEP_ID=MMETSP1324-20130603/79774_1 /TAXON_ID=236786 /ORGANISM="Florenciella sp., Strain RCC1587" /LENGTH=41 /DNA_ID= /DNA_START= /DNA_END= /DNA_ORIENTATION=